MQGTFIYKVDSHESAPGAAPSGHVIVKPTQVEILEQDGTDKVTLMACNPKFSARERIVVTATLQSPPAPATPIPPRRATVRSPPTPPGRARRRRLVRVGSGHLLDRSRPVDLVPHLAHRPEVARWTRLPRSPTPMASHAERAPVPLWHKVVVYAVGAPIFFVVLFVAYENIARLLPASY